MSFATRSTTLDLKRPPCTVALDLRVIGEYPVAAVAAHSSDVDAEAIVVGARGHGQFGELTIGRVPRQLLHTAARPMIIVAG